MDYCLFCLIPSALFMAHFSSPSQFHLSGPAAVRRPVLSRLSVQLVCCCGPGSRPAGQPHPEGAAAEGPTGHQPGEAPCVPAAAVHQHPLPGRTPAVALNSWSEGNANWSCVCG